MRGVSVVLDWEAGSVCFQSKIKLNCHCTLLPARLLRRPLEVNAQCLDAVTEIMFNLGLYLLPDAQQI